MDAYEEGLRARVWLRVRKHKNGCWEWTGAAGNRRVKPTGYGRVKVRGKLTLPHRLIWEWFNGKIPAGMCVLHSCDNDACVNPKHLFLGTHQDNTADALAKGRHVMPPMPSATRVRSDGKVRCCTCRDYFLPSEYRKDRSNKSHGCQSNCRACHNAASGKGRKRKKR